MSRQKSGRIHNVSLKNTVLELLESIALEETAVSSILNAEADKIKAFVGKNLEFPSKPSTKEIIFFNETVNKMMDSLLMTEWLLFRKLDSIMQIDIHKMEENNSSSYDSNDSVWGDDSTEEESIFQDRWDLDTIILDDKDVKKEKPKTDNGDEDDIYW